MSGWFISCEVVLIRMLLGSTDDKWTLVQVMASCRQAPSHYLSEYWLKSMSPDGSTVPQWVNPFHQESRPYCSNTYTSGYVHTTPSNPERNQNHNCCNHRSHRYSSTNRTGHPHTSSNNLAAMCHHRSTEHLDLPHTPSSNHSCHRCGLDLGCYNLHNPGNHLHQNRMENPHRLCHSRCLNHSRRLLLLYLFAFPCGLHSSRPTNLFDWYHLAWRVCWTSQTVSRKICYRCSLQRSHLHHLSLNRIEICPHDSRLF